MRESFWSTALLVALTLTLLLVLGHDAHKAWDRVVLAPLAAADR